MQFVFIFIMILFSSIADAEPMTLNIPNMPLSEALKLLAQHAHINVLVSPAVQGATSLQMQQVEPRVMLNSLMLSHGLVKTVSNDIWLIAPNNVMMKSLSEQSAWQQSTEANAVLMTRVWKIRYAKAAVLATMLLGDNGAIVSDRGQLQADARTNIIFARDTNARLQVINQLINRLDVPVKQVLIEARLVSIDQDAEKLLGVEFDVQTAEGSSSSTKPSAQNTETAGRYSIAVAHLPDGSLLDVKLAALEQQGRADLISTPSLFTGNDQEASIEAGEEVPYQEVSESGGTAVTFKKAVLGLQVTPQILPGSQVLLALKINQDRPAARTVQGVPAISTRQITTNVQIKSGQTIVLGGIYEINHELNQQSLPFLGKIPLLGLLFTQENRRDQKRELLIFVTPKIMPQAI